VLPGDLNGQTSIRFDLFDRELGRRFTGAFTLTIQGTTATGSIVINAGSQQLSGNAVNYQPIEVRGVETRPVETVGDQIRIAVPLEREHLQDPVPIGEITGDERFLVLSSEPPVRVLDIHMGPRLIVGRCYGKDIQKGSKAWDRVRMACPMRRPGIDWVVVWDDARFNRLLAVLDLETTRDGYLLHVENPTDYSRVPSPLEIATDGENAAVADAGDRVSVPVRAEQEVALRSACAEGAQEFLRVIVEELEAGEAIVPVVRTIRSRFRWPPDAEGAGEIHFLGLWLPWTAPDLERILRPSHSRLWIAFPEENALGLEIDWNYRFRSLAIAGTVNLRACLDGR